MRDTTTAKRFAITHVSDRTSLRRLTFAQQGRDTYETRADGERALAAFVVPGGLDRVLSSTELATLRVSEIECYASGDPVHYYIETEG